MGERRMNKSTETRKKKEERKKVISGANGQRPLSAPDDENDDNCKLLFSVGCIVFMG